MSPFLADLIPIVAYAAAAAIVAQRVWRWRLSRRSRAWPSVVGRVVVARIVQRQRREDDDETKSSRPGMAEYFALEVRYRYRVRGTAYEGTKYSVDDPEFSDYGEAIDALHGIAARGEVLVYYDPARPQRAVLRNG